MHFRSLFPPSPLLGRVEKENSLWQLRRKKERQRETERAKRGSMASIDGDGDGDNQCQYRFADDASTEQ